MSENEMKQENSEMTLAAVDARFAATYPATTKQVSYLNSLMRDRDVPYEMQSIETDALDKWTASNLINFALSCRPMSELYAENDALVRAENAWLTHAERSDPESQEDLALHDALFPNGYGVEAPKAVTPKAGRYAITFEGEVKFFRVDRPTDGKWAGYTFLNAQASDDFFPVKNATRKAAILAAIADDKDASARYGKLLGVCGVCGRTLTDPESRELGIGPVCRGK